jgi:hypothetical protein
MVHDGNDDQGVIADLVDEVVGKSPNARPADIRKDRCARIGKLKQPSRQRSDFRQKVVTQAWSLLLISVDGAKELDFSFI